MNIETLSKKQLANIIEGAEEDIIDIRQQASAAQSLLSRNLYQARIKNRQTIINRAKAALQSLSK